MSIAQNPTIEQVVNDVPGGWHVFTVGLTCEFRTTRRDDWSAFRVQQLVVDTSPEDGGGATGSWRTLASATTAREACETLHKLQMDFVKEMRRRARG